MFIYISTCFIGQNKMLINLGKSERIAMPFGFLSYEK
jgi:hypothetical protein